MKITIAAIVIALFCFAMYAQFETDEPPPRESMGEGESGNMTGFYND